MQGDAITIRNSNLGDLPAVHELAQLDGGVEPQGDMLLAFVDGTLRVAVGRMDGRVVADPFHLTRDLVELVKATWRASARAAAPCTGGWRAWLRPRVGRCGHDHHAQLAGGGEPGGGDPAAFERATGDRPSRLRFRRTRTAEVRAPRAESAASRSPTPPPAATSIFLPGRRPATR